MDHYACRLSLASLSLMTWHSPLHWVLHLGLNLSGSIGPVLQEFRSKSQDLGLPFFISKNLTGSCLSTVEQQLFMQRPCLVQCVTAFPATVSMPTQVLFSFSQLQLMAPKALVHLQQKLCAGNSMQDHPSVAKVIQQTCPPLLKLVSGRRHIQSSWAQCSYRSTFWLQSQQQMKFQVATGLLFRRVTLTVQRGFPPQVGGVWAMATQRRARIRMRRDVLIIK